MIDEFRSRLILMCVAFLVGTEISDVITTIADASLAMPNSSPQLSRRLFTLAAILKQLAPL